MSDNIPDVRELRLQGDLNQLQNYFNEPHIKQWTVEMLEQLKALYELGLEQDDQDPVDWIVGFDQSHPIHMKIGAETTRLGKILTMVKLYVARKIRETTNQSQGGRKQIRREYE